MEASVGPSEELAKNQLFSNRLRDTNQGTSSNMQMRDAQIGDPSILIIHGTGLHYHGSWYKTFRITSS